MAILEGSTPLALPGGQNAAAQMGRPRRAGTVLGTSGVQNAQVGGHSHRLHRLNPRHRLGFEYRRDAYRQDPALAQSDSRSGY